jgi:hypothetical protein
MSIALPDTPKFTICRTGLKVHGELSFEEWAEMAPILNEAARGIAFVVGDWLVYGSGRFGRTGGVNRVKAEDYEKAVNLTGLDRTTLQNYAHVSRKVPPSLRNKELSWEHHKVVAKLAPPDQGHWLSVAVENGGGDRPVSTRRLRKSIQAGRLLDEEEVNLPSSDRGIENHIPFVNRLVAWWTRMTEQSWLEGASDEQRAALKRDLEPLVSIYQELEGD